jgi:long-chain acyl-CoA synthetase
MTYLSWMPPTSIGGLTLGLQALLGAEQLAVNNLIGANSATAGLIKAIGRSRVTSAGLPPFLGQQLLRALRAGAKLPESLLVIGLGGGRVPPGLVAQLEAVSGRQVLTGYGCTEMCGAVMTTRFDDEPAVRDSTIGRPLPGVKVRAGSRGRLLVKSPARALGYLGHDGLLPFSDADGWFDTGDRIRRDESGNFTFLGRDAHVIIRGGRKIDGAMIEDALRAHPRVAMAAVTGMPSRLAGEQDIVALVVRSDQSINASQLRSHCASTLGTAFCPRRIEFVTTLPVLPSGELDRTLIGAAVQGGR